MTQKCHPEISGCDIEYVWGYSKLYFRLHFNDSEAPNLEENVRDLLGTNVLIKEQMDKFVCKAQNYKMTYYYFIKRTDKASKMNTGAQNLHEKIEQITQMFKNHRSALDSNNIFTKTLSWSTTNCALFYQSLVSQLVVQLETHNI